MGLELFVRTVNSLTDWADATDVWEVCKLVLILLSFMHSLCQIPMYDLKALNITPKLLLHIAYLGFRDSSKLWECYICLRRPGEHPGIFLSVHWQCLHFLQTF